MRFVLLLRRIAEMMFMGILISVTTNVALILIKNVFYVYLLAAIIENIVFFFIIGRQLYEFCTEIPVLSVYYKFNLTASVIYSALSVGAAYFVSVSSFGSSHKLFEKIYRYAFFNFKTFNYTVPPHTPLLSTVGSAICYGVILILFVCILPLFVPREMSPPPRADNNEQ